MNKKTKNKMKKIIENSLYNTIYGNLKYDCLKLYKGKEKEFILDLMKYIEENYEGEKK